MKQTALQSGGGELLDLKDAWKRPKRKVMADIRLPLLLALFLAMLLDALITRTGWRMPEFALAARTAGNRAKRREQARIEREAKKMREAAAREAEAERRKKTEKPSPIAPHSRRTWKRPQTETLIRTRTPVPFHPREAGRKRRKVGSSMHVVAEDAKSSDDRRAASAHPFPAAPSGGPPSGRTFRESGRAPRTKFEPSSPRRVKICMKVGNVKAVTVAVWVVTISAAFWVGGWWFGGEKVGGDPTATPSQIGEGETVATGARVKDSGGQPMLSSRLRPGRASAAARVFRKSDGNKDVEELIREAESYLSGAIANRGETLKALQMMDALSASDIPIALEVLGERPANRAQEMLMGAVFTRWAEFDGKEAINHAVEHLPDGLRDRMMQSILSTWPLNDPDGALAWYENGTVDFRSVGEKRRFFTHLYQGLAVRDLDHAFIACGKLESMAEKSLAARGIANALGAGDAALQKLSAWPDDAGRTLAQQMIVRDWAAYEPDSAADWVVRNTRPVELPQMINETITAWVKADPNAAAEWLSDYNGKPAADPAVSTLARNIVHRDPESAFAWAASISNQIMRRQTLASVVDQWRIREPATAADFVRSSGLPEEEIEALLR